MQYLVSNLSGWNSIIRPETQNKFTVETAI